MSMSITYLPSKSEVPLAVAFSKTVTPEVVHLVRQLLYHLLRLFENIHSSLPQTIVAVYIY